MCERVRFSGALMVTVLPWVPQGVPEHLNIEVTGSEITFKRLSGQCWKQGPGQRKITNDLSKPLTWSAPVWWWYGWGQRNGHRFWVYFEGRVYRFVLGINVGGTVLARFPLLWWNTCHKLLKGGKIHCGLWFQRFQSLVSWFQSKNFMAEVSGGEKLLTSWQLWSRESGPGEKLEPPKTHPQLPTSSTHFYKQLQTCRWINLLMKSARWWSKHFSRPHLNTAALGIKPSGHVFGWHLMFK